MMLAGPESPQEDPAPGKEQVSAQKPPRPRKGREMLPDLSPWR